jgi:GTP-binding protein EngB required for normal cell division
MCGKLDTVPKHAERRNRGNRRTFQKPAHDCATLMAPQICSQFASLYPNTMTRAVLFLGSTGAGKSTLINKLSGKEEAKVSHSRWEDGTATLTPVVDGVDMDLVYMDTPGLNSANFKVCVTELFQHYHGDKKVLIVLVLSTQTSRVQDFIQTFDKTVDDLIGNDKDFFVVWTHYDEKQPDEDDYAHVLKRYKGKAKVFCDSGSSMVTNGISALKGALSAKDLFSTLKVNKAPVKSVPLPLRAPSLPPSVNKPPTGPSATAVAKKNPPVYPLGFPGFITCVDHFNVKPLRKGELEKCIAAVLKAKEDDEVEYQALKLVGDAAVRYLVYTCLYGGGERALIETKAKKLLDNDDECAMPRFFNEHIATAHKAMFQNEVLSGHRKADVVEALIEFARRNGCRALKFIITELFRLVGMEEAIKMKKAIKTEKAVKV